MHITEAIADANLLQPFVGELESWAGWMTALRCLYGLPLDESEAELVEACTGRSIESMPADGFETALMLCGRRSGKSRIAAAVAAFEASLGGHEQRLAPGETGLVSVLSPTRSQSRIVNRYVRAAFHSSPLLAGEVERETDASFALRNGLQVEVGTADFRWARGFTLAACVLDEACFIGQQADSPVRSDTELVRALLPALATTGGKLIAISTPYRKSGWCWETYQRNHGNESGGVLVWNASSRTMNPTLPQRVVDAALRDDLAAAKSEYLAQWRDDVSAYIPRDVVEGLVVAGRRELQPVRFESYFAFCDVSGGRSDDASLAIAHVEAETVVVDLVRRWKPPFDPSVVVARMAELLQRYGVVSVTGDSYGAEYTTQAFRRCEIDYQKSSKAKSQLYGELLPRMCSGGIELPDDEALINQLCALERRTRSGGHDTIDHPRGGHDDLANVIAGVADAMNVRGTPRFEVIRCF